MSRSERERDEIFSELSLQMIHERAAPCLIGICDPWPGGMLMAFLWATGNIVERIMPEEEDE